MNAAGEHATGSLRGKQWQPRDIAKLCYGHGFTDAIDLVTAVAVCLSESQGYDHAINDNKRAIGECKKDQIVRNVETLEPYIVVDPAKGLLKYSTGDMDTFPTEVMVITSRDVGLFQINIPAVKITTPDENTLYDVDVNVFHAFSLWQAREFQPWYSYTLNVYTRDTYIKRATRGVGNFFADELLKLGTDVLSGEPYQHKITTPVLHYQHSVEVLDGAASRAIAMLRELKTHANNANDKRIDMIIAVQADAKVEAKK